MRVLHVMPSIELNTGGVSRSVPALCRSLHALGLEVPLYTFRRTGRPLTVNPEDDAFYLQAFTPVRGSRELPTLSFYRRLCRDLVQFDLVHLHSVWNPAITLAAFACRRAGVPYVLSPHGMLHHGAVRRKRWRKEAYYRLFERQTIAGATTLHFLTDAEAEHSRPFLREETPWVVVPNGIDPALPEGVRSGRFRQLHPELDGRRIMLYLGRLHPIKGLGLQAQALALLVRDFPDLMWVLVGANNGEWERLSRKVRAMGLEEHVIWTDLLPPEGCLEALMDADVFVLTSRQEAHSMAMNEALAVGVPVVVTDTVQFNLIREAGAGHVVPWDSSHLAAGIADILRHPEQARKMREAGRRLVAERLAWPRIAERMVQAYEEILRTSCRSRSATVCGVHA